MISLSSKDWLFLGTEGDKAIFKSNRDDTKIFITKVKFYNPEIDGAVTITDGRIELTDVSRRKFPNLQAQKILNY